MRAVLVVAFGVLFSFAVTGCRFFSGDTPLLVSDSQPIAYVKRPLGSEKNPLDAIQFQPGSDLFIRDLASTESQERNVSGILTRNLGDVSDPEPSYDGRQIVFSLHCTSGSASECANDKSWNIWTYDLATEKLTSVIADFTVRNLGDDLDPAFLPDGRIVFISTRQHKTLDKLQYKYVDGDGRSPATLLHVMNADGTNIQQISFNQYDDRNPTVLANGRIMFSRWGAAGSRHYSLFTINPDGSDVSAYYGAHSPGDAFLHARELEDGRLVSTVLPLKSQWDGGALMLLDVKNFSEIDRPAPWAPATALPNSGQVAATVHDIPIDDEISRFGRYAKPFPVPNGNGDVLVSYSFFDESVEVNLKENEEVLQRTHEEAPRYGIYKFNLKDKNLIAIEQATNTYIFTDPISLMPRVKPKLLGATVASNGNVFSSGEEGIVNIKSVYDTDHFEYMGPAKLTPAERALTPVPQIVPADVSLETRERVADIEQLRNTPVERRPARFLRVVQAQITPPGFSTLSIGNSEYEMRRLLGYAAIEADGSVQVKVPANRPFTLSVVDKFGRAFSQQSSWLQVLPGETLQCKGCHSPRDSVSINPSSMAEQRSLSDPTRLVLSEDMQDSFTFNSYSSLQSSRPVNGDVDFVKNIQPLFDLPRSPQGACSSCHNGQIDSTNNPSGMNLQGSGTGASNARSYDVLLRGEVFLDENGRVLLEERDGQKLPMRQLPVVMPGYARGSYLIEKIFNEELFSERGLPDAGLDHSNMLNDAEKRLLSEWIDLGAQYINSPYDENGEIRSSAGSLSSATFSRIVSTAMIINCAGCHRLLGPSGDANNRFVGGDFILYDDSSQDFVAASGYVDDFNNPQNNRLLTIPMDTSIHPAKDNGQPYLTSDMILYKNLVQWIEEGANDNSVVKISVPFAVGQQ